MIYGLSSKRTLFTWKITLQWRSCLLSIVATDTSDYCKWKRLERKIVSIFQSFVYLALSVTPLLVNSSPIVCSPWITFSTRKNLLYAAAMIQNICLQDCWTAWLHRWGTLCRSMQDLPPSLMCHKIPRIGHCCHCIPCMPGPTYASSGPSSSCSVTLHFPDVLYSDSWGTWELVHSYHSSSVSW